MPNCGFRDACYFCPVIDGIIDELDVSETARDRLLAKLFRRPNLAKALCLLYVNRKKVVKREDIRAFVWECKVTDNSVTQTMYQLRMLFHNTPLRIYNFRSMGYGLTLRSQNEDQAKSSHS
ncbi:winged helix-turn-helix domain-containing protein [Vibrio maritimus]